VNDNEDTVAFVLRILRRCPGLKTEYPIDAPQDLNLLEAGVLDSFGFLEFIMDLQDESGVALTVDPTALMTIGGIVAALRNAALD
jgi:acyl carrier protein